jgi:hypothetical protein
MTKLKAMGSASAWVGWACAGILLAAASKASAGSTTFPPDETFDEVIAPALPAGWVSSGGNDWRTVTTAYDTEPNAAYGASIPSPLDITLDTPAFTPAGATTLMFRHQYNLEYGFDGAVLEISIGGGEFQDIVAAGGVFLANGYDLTLAFDAVSPLANRNAWTGNSGGFVTTSVKLPTASTGQPTRLRLRTADDDSEAPANPGWWVDSIHLAFATLPSAEVMFAPDVVMQSSPSTLTILLTNPTLNAATLTADFVVDLPPGLVANASTATTTCAGGAGAGSTSAALTLAAGAILPVNASCTLSVSVHADAAGMYPIDIMPGALQTSIGNSDGLTGATLFVVTPPAIAVTPSALALTAFVGSSRSAPLTITNNGQFELVYSITEGEAMRQAGRGAAPVARMQQATASKRVPSLRRHAGEAVNGAVPQAPAGTQQISQMADNTPGDTAATCGNEFSNFATSWWRRFYFGEHAGVGPQTSITAVTISSGVWDGANDVPVTINLYTVAHATPVDTIPLAALVPLTSTSAIIDSGFVELTIPVFAAIADTVGNDLVVEYHIDDIFTAEFYPGANATPETHTTFMSAPACNVPDPTPVVELDPGLETFHLTMSVDVGGELPATCSNVSDIPWLKATPPTGRVVSGAHARVSIVADASELAEGIYMARICVGSNDPENPLVSVPLTLNVTPVPFVLCTGDGDEVFCSDFEPQSATFSARGVHEPYCGGLFRQSVRRCASGSEPAAVLQ